MRRFLTYTILIGILSISVGNGIVLSMEHGRLLAGVLLAALMLVQAPWSFRGPHAALALGIVTIAGALAATRPGLEGNVLFAALSVAAIGGLLGHAEGLSPRHVAASLAFLGLALAATGIDAFWYLTQEWGRGAGTLASEISGLPSRWGPTASGVWLSLLGLCLLIGDLCGRRLRVRDLIVAPLILALPVLVVHFGVRWVGVLGASNGSFAATYPFLVQLAAIPVMGFLLAWVGLPSSAHRPESATWPQVSRKWKAATAASLAALLLSGSVMPSKARRIPPTRGKVLILDWEARGSSFSCGSWDRLGFMKFGLYGLMVRDLERTNHEVVISKDALTKEQLEGVSTVMLINPGRVPEASELFLLGSYVNAGGGLLVLSDHTDIMGSQAPTNTILAPYGMELRFDTGMETARTFAGNLDIRHVGVFPPGIDPLNLQILHGATLRVRSPARPVVVGKAMWSDFGDLGNPGRGAFLGDYSFWPGYEQTGDVVLVAAAEAGKGRVLAFGDTSTFQAVALGRSYGALRDIFSWLEGNEVGDGFLPAGSLSWIGLVISLVLGLSLLLGVGPGHLAIVGAAVLASSCWLGGQTRGDIDNVRVLKNAPPRSALVLHSGHLPAWDVDQFRERSIEGLLMCAERDQLQGVLGDLRTCDNWEAAKVVFLVAPRKVLDQSFTDDLNTYLSAGGIVVASAGFEERSGLVPFLDQHGIEILGVPLGAAPFHPEWETYTGIQGTESWPVRVRDARESHVLFEVDGHPIIVGVGVGKGTLYVVGDSWFFTDKNFEGEDKFVEPNIDLFCRLLGHKNGLEDCKK